MNDTMKMAVQTSVALACLGILAACGGGSSGSGTGWSPDSNGKVSLKFAAHAGNTPITCASSLKLGSTERAVKMADFRFYISNVRLIRADGEKVALKLAQSDDYNYTSEDGQNAVTLIDLEQTGTGKCEDGSAAINATIEGTAPAGTYTGVEMTLGVPFELNHLNANDAATPRVLQNSVHPAMSWNWRGGRKFTNIQFDQDKSLDPAQWSSADAGEDGRILFHLGSTGCVGNPAEGTPISSCTAPNRVPVAFAAFNPHTQTIAFDASALFNFDIAGADAGNGRCMSSATAAACARPFAALALDWKADGSGTGEALAARAQSVLRVVTP